MNQRFDHGDQNRMYQNRNENLNQNYNMGRPQYNCVDPRNNFENQNFANRNYNHNNGQRQHLNQNYSAIPVYKNRGDEARVEKFNHAKPYMKSNRRQREPDKFNDTNVEWSDYLKHFEMVAAWNDWNEDEKVMQLGMSLQGEAQKVLNDLSKYLPLNDYDTLVNELSKRFNPVDRETAYRIEFRNRIRQNGETPMQFGYALQRLATKAFPNIDRIAQEQWVLDQFISGLGNMELRKHVQFGHPSKLYEAISLAVEFEGFENDNLKKMLKPQPGKLMAIPNSDPNTELLSKLYSKLDKSLGEIDTLTKEVKNLKEQNQRYPNTQNYQNYQRRNDSRPQRDYSAIQCFRCHEMGHYSKQCPQNMRTQNQGIAKVDPKFENRDNTPKQNFNQGN